MSLKLIGKDDTTIDGNGLKNYFYIEGFVSGTGWCNQIRFKSPGNGNVKVAIYRDSDDARMAKKDAATAVSAGWNTIYLEAPCYLVGTVTYYLAIISDQDIIAYDNVGAGSLEYYKAATYSTFTFPAALGAGWTSQAARCIIIAGWSIETYVETAKVQVILAVPGQSSLATFAELGKVINIPVVQGQSSLETFLETEKLQLIVVVQGEYDAVGEQYDETGKEQVVLATAGELDRLIANESSKIQVILAVVGQSDSGIFNETAKPIIIKVAQGELDSAIFSELGKLQAILAVITHTEIYTSMELGHLQTILAVVGESDSFLRQEIGKLLLIKAAIGGFDHLTATYMSGGVLELPLIKYPLLKSPVAKYPILKYPIHGVKGR